MSPSTSSVYAKRLQWSNQQILAAMKAVDSGGAINQDAREHGVPCSTLKYRLSGKVRHGNNQVPKVILLIKKSVNLGYF